jgi:RHS repeat-associated protein
VQLRSATLSPVHHQGRRSSLPATIVALALVLVTACSPTPPTPSPSAAPSPVPSGGVTGSKVVGDLALEACDPEGLLPCEHAAVILEEPIAGAGVSLTWSSEWADARLDRPDWNADSLGLGGWAIDVVQRYDPERGILLGGDGSWRIAAAVDIGDGFRAVPAFDGRRYFVFDAGWHHVRTVSSLTGFVQLEVTYDEAGRLETLAGARGLDLKVQRTADGAPELVLGSGRVGSAVLRDADGRFAGLGRPDGTLLQVTWTASGLVASWAATGRGTTTYAWDATGRLTREIDPDGVVRNVASTVANGASIVAIDAANGAIAMLRTQRAGDILRRVLNAADGTTTTLETSADGSTRLVTPDGTVITAGAVAHPRWDMAAPIRTPYVETRPDGTEYRVETTTTMGTGATEPAGGAWTTESVVNGQQYVETFDPGSRQLSNTDPAGRESTWTFDDQGRLTNRQVPGEAPIAYAYDAAGFLATVTVGVGDVAAPTAYAYNTDIGEVVATRPDGSTERFILDNFGRIGRHTDAEENLVVQLDPAGDVLQLRAGAHPATTFGYSDGGRDTAYIPPAVGEDAGYERITYTPTGLMAAITTLGGRQIQLSHDGAGRTTSWTFDRGTSTASYDATSGRLASNTSADGVTTTFDYSGDALTGLAWSGPVAGSVSRRLDSFLDPIALLVNDGPAVAFGYDDGGLLVSIAGLVIERDPRSGLPVRMTLGGVSTAYEYDGAGRLRTSTTSSSGTDVLAIRYERDQLGRVTTEARTGVDGSMATTTFRYDTTGRLLGFDRDGTTTTNGFDASGNRLTVSRGAISVRASYDDRDRIVSQGAATYRWDPDGTLLERDDAAGRTTYDFDDLGALHAVGLPDGRRVEYVVDAGGRRIGRSVDGELTDGYLYDVDDSIVAWTDGSGAVIARFAYDDAGRLALVQRDGRDLIVVNDQAGSPILLVDSRTGEVAGDATYDPWGNPDGSLASLIPFGFAGGLTDPLTGLVHFGLRDYDPETGRWTAADPLRYDGGDTNLYRYAGGDPVNNVDPTGTVARMATSGTGASDRVTIAAGPGGRRAPAPGASRPASGTATGGGRRKTYQDAGPPSRPTRDVAQPRPTPGPPGAVTFCLSLCFPPNGEVTGGVYGDDSTRIDQCTGFCMPVGQGQGFCLGACFGGGNDGDFACLLVCTYGDPHLRTADGANLGFQAAGEFLVVKVPDGTLEIQARFEPPGSKTWVTLTTALAMRIGPDRVAMYADPDRPLVVNGTVVERSDYGTTLPGGGIVERHGSFATVIWPGGARLAVHSYGHFMNYDFAAPDAVAKSMVGIFGNVDGNAANDLTTRDGIVIDQEDPSFLDELYGRFADSWRINPKESLFDYLPGESSAKFQRRDIPSEPVTIDTLEVDIRAEAEAVCRAAGIAVEPVLSNCVLDVAVTGDASYAGGAATVASGQERAAARIDIGLPIPRELRVAGNLGAGRVEKYHFTATAGDVVYLDADVACGQDLRWRLLAPDGGVLVTEEACRDLGRRVLQAAGEWRIEVSSASGATGPFAFRVLTAPKPVQRDIAIGGTGSGALTAAGEVHRYAFEASAGQRIYVDSTVGCDSPLLWQLRGPEGGVYDIARTCEDLGRQVLPTGGQWVLELYADGLETGTYGFRLLAVAAPTERTISIGQAVNDRIEAVGDAHRYRFAGQVGQRIVIDTGQPCTGEILWRLLRPDGGATTIGTSCTDSSAQTLDVGGDWIIEVFSDTTATGAYTFTVTTAP